MEKDLLERLVNEENSISEIAELTKASQRKVFYWLKKYNLKTKWHFRRSIHSCPFCKKPTKNYKFCSVVCRHQFNWNLKKEKIERDEKIEGVKTGKRYLIEVRGNQCEICKSTKWQNKKIPLVMDHINGNPYDNTLNNLRLICPNCDAQTSTYKGKNKGNGRYFRKIRYSEGKSF